jgi:glucosamine--fructose-6-phosphate aminotransferase (isomerizing)
VDLASEFRYRNPLINKGDLMVLISQSGETADTMAALEEGRENKACILTICNVMDSTMARHSDGVLYTRAGPEIGVAATKTFMAQLVALDMLSLYMAEQRGTRPPQALSESADKIVRLPHYLEATLTLENQIRQLAEKYHRAQDFLFLGRGPNYPIALEGALKLKEISYIHAEGYAAGEMKHGPIALIDENMPVVVLVTPGRHYEKVFSNLEEVKARNGKVIALAMEGDEEVAAHADDLILIPRAPVRLMPCLLTVPLQLLAYHIAVLRGTDVDQPRNLAKSVTVE